MLRHVSRASFIAILALTACRSNGGSSSATDPATGYTGPIGAGAYWLVDPSSKVQPSTAPGALSGTIALEGPRASTEAYQIVLRPTGGGMRNVNATATDLRSDAGATIAAANLTLFREFFIDFGSIDRKRNVGGVLPVPENSPTGDSKLPDPLIPLVDPYSGRPAGAPFDVWPDTNRPLWLDLRIPASAAPGTYRGEIRITSDGQDPLVVPVVLTVWDLTLPDSASVTTYFKIDWSDVNGFHAGMDTGYPNDHPRTKDYVKRYEELVHAHRVNSRPTWVPYPNGCSPPTRAQWDELDAVLGPYMDGSHWDDGVPSTFFGVGISVGDPMTCSDDEYVKVGHAWATHLKEKGWFSRSWIYAADEPSPELYPEIARQSRLLQSGDADWKHQIIDTTMPRASTAPLLDGALGVYVLCLKCFDSWELLDDPKDPGAHVYGRAEWPSRLLSGSRMWFYESIAQEAPYPGFATNTLDAGEPRIMMWGSWYEGASGFLYYSVTQWERANPWGPNISFPKTGDGVLIYPGNHDGAWGPAGSPQTVAIDGPVPSLRLKTVRAGMQDWALFQLAETHGLGAQARAEVARAYNQLGGCEWSGCSPPAWYWKTDHALLADVRRNVAAALMAAGVH